MKTWVARCSDDFPSLIRCVWSRHGFGEQIAGEVLPEPGSPRWPFTLFGLLVVAAGQLAISALATAAVHGAAKLLFRASGQYVRLLRVLWVGSIVLWIGALPVVGPLVGGVLYLLVALVAISEVEGVERLQALILVIGLRAIVMLATFLSAA